MQTPAWWHRVFRMHGGLFKITFKLHWTELIPIFKFLFSWKVFSIAPLNGFRALKVFCLSLLPPATCPAGVWLMQSPGEGPCAVRLNVNGQKLFWHYRGSVQPVRNPHPSRFHHVSSIMPHEFETFCSWIKCNNKCKIKCKKAPSHFILDVVESWQAVIMRIGKSFSFTSRFLSLFLQWVSNSPLCSQLPGYLSEGLKMTSFRAEGQCCVWHRSKITVTLPL